MRYYSKDKKDENEESADRMNYQQIGKGEASLRREREIFRVGQ